MKRHIITLIVACHVASTLCTDAGADEEIANHPVVRSSERGNVYAKSMPDEGYGQKGKTKVFTVAKDRDTLTCQYDWYASEIYIGGDGTVVRFGPWHRGLQSKDNHFAVGFYRNGKTIREHTTFEMEGMGSGVSTSKSHYTIFKRHLGFRWLKGDVCVYEIEGVSGKVFSFDLDTGDVIGRTTKGAAADARKSFEMVENAPLQRDRDQLLKQWQQLPERLRKTLYHGGPMGLDGQGHIQLIGVYNQREGDQEKPQRFFHLRQTGDFGRSLIWSILVNAEDETYRILFDRREVLDGDASWLKLQGE